MAPSTLRSRQHDSPMLWLSVLGGSLALHLIVLLLGRWYFAQPQALQPSGAPIPLDFVEIDPNALAAKMPKSVTPSNTATQTELPKVAAQTEPSTAQPSISAPRNPEATVETPKTASPTPRSTPPNPESSPSPKPSPQSNRATQPGQQPIDQPSGRPASSRGSTPRDRSPTPATPTPSNPDPNPSRDGQSGPSTPSSPTSGGSTNNPTPTPTGSPNPLPTGGLFTAQVSPSFKRSSQTQNDSRSATLLSAPTFQKKIDLVSGLGSQKRFDLDVQVEVQHETTTSAKKSSIDRVRGTVSGFKVLPDSLALQQVDPAQRERLRVNLEDTLNQILSESPIEVEVTVNTNSDGGFAPASLWVTQIVLTR